MYNQQQQPPITPLVPPHHQETFTSAVTVPIVQSLVTGALVGLALGVLVWAFEIKIEYAPPWKIGLVSCVVVIAFVWLINLKAWAQRLERLLNIDFNGDGYVGEPQQVEETLKVTVDSEQGRLSENVWLKGGREKLAIMARAMLNGDTFSERQWSGKQGSGKVFSPDEYHNNVMQLLARGMIVTVSADGSKNNGYKLANEKGRALMRELAGVARPLKQEPQPSPLPSQKPVHAFEVGYVDHERAPQRDLWEKWKDQDL